LLKNSLKIRIRRVYLDEANVLGVAAEALPAAHEAILPDQTMRVATDPAAKNEQASQYRTAHNILKT
jgi:hypothetical protein